MLRSAALPKKRRTQQKNRRKEKTPKLYILLSLSQQFYDFSKKLNSNCFVPGMYDLQYMKSTHWVMRKFVSAAYF